MAHKTLIGGTAYEITGGKTLIDGAEYSIKGGRTLVDGTGYDISFNIPVGDLAVGSSVFLNVNGVSTEFLVVHQGNPDSSLYAASCDGTWLLMKEVYEVRRWTSRGNNEYWNGPEVYLTSAYGGVSKNLDPSIQEAVAGVKIPYYHTGSLEENVIGGYSGRPAPLFLLSGREVGFDDATESLPYDGAILSFFSGDGNTDANRIAYYNGTATQYWLRSPYCSNNTDVYTVQRNGVAQKTSHDNSCGMRPALILPSETIVDRNFNVLA